MSKTVPPPKPKTEETISHAVPQAPTQVQLKDYLKGFVNKAVHSGGFTAEEANTCWNAINALTDEG